MPNIMVYRLYLKIQPVWLDASDWDKLIHVKVHKPFILDGYIAHNKFSSVEILFFKYCSPFLTKSRKHMILVRKHIKAHLINIILWYSDPTEKNFRVDKGKLSMNCMIPLYKNKYELCYFLYYRCYCLQLL